MKNLMPIQKTAKGVSELTHPSGTLDLKSRQFLILADGKRTVACIKHLRPSMDVNGIFIRLASEGYLVGERAAQVINAQPLSESRPLPDDQEESLLTEEAIVQAKIIMTETTRRYVGILGTDLIRRISAAHSLMQLKSCIAEWNMAIRDSRQGKTAADQYLQEVQSVLGSDC